MALLFLAKSTESKRFLAPILRHFYIRKSEVRAVLNDKYYSSFESSPFFISTISRLLIQSIQNFFDHDF